MEFNHSPTNQAVFKFIFPKEKSHDRVSPFWRKETSFFWFSKVYQASEEILILSILS
jgi:hypothetical protein